MKRPIILILLLMTAVVSAQYDIGDINLDFGEKVPKEQGSIMAIAGEINDSIYALSRTKREFFLQTFDGKTKRLLDSKPIKLERGQEIRDFVIVGRKLFLMLSWYDETLRIYRFLAKEIKDNQVVSTNAIISIREKYIQRRGEFLVKISKD
ncbi:MAG: hypothetical protein AAF901_02380, partial [Bacteroidota bacterium]